MRGNITRRGKNSWRLKFDLDRDVETGVRRFRTVTVRGTKKDAETELARLLNELHKGTLIEASALTVGAYLWQWLDGKHKLSPVTRERYADAIEKAIIPELGAIELQKLKPMHVKQWLTSMLDKRSGRTVANIRLVLFGALKEALELELVGRNVAAAVKAPKIESDEVKILGADELHAVLGSLAGSRLLPIANLALATGMRRGELLALRWSDVDLAGAMVNVARSLEQTVSGGLRFKEPKTRNSRRPITLGPTAVAELKLHRKEQLELRLQLGLGKHGAGALVFCNGDGTPISPNSFSVMWGRAVPEATFHSLRHTHASALLAAGVDVLTVSRRLGHAKPTITLNIYGHKFGNTDQGCADVIERMLAK
jgi:integrase